MILHFVINVLVINFSFYVTIENNEYAKQNHAICGGSLRLIHTVRTPVKKMTHK